MSLKEYLSKEKEKRSKRLAEIDNEVATLEERNKSCDKEDELREIGDTLDELKAEKAEKEAELAEIDAQIADLEKQEKAQKEKEEEQPNPERAKFLVFEKRNGGKPTMFTEEQRKALEARAEALKKDGKMKIEHPQLRAVTIASGQLVVPTEAHGIENPAEVPYSTILDFVKVEDMTGAGYNAVSLVDEWSEAKATNEGASIDESNPTFAIVTIQPEKGFKTYSTISNEVLKTTPLNYYGKVEESAQIALRRKVANLIVSKAVGAQDDEGNDVNDSLELSAINDGFLRSVCFAFGGDEGIFGTASLVLNKKDLSKLGELMSSYTKDYVFEIEPSKDNPNIGIIKKGGLSVRYILSSQLTPFDEASEGDTFALYGDLKSVEVDLFGAYDIRVSEDYAFKNDLLAIRGTAQIGVGVVRKHGLIELKKGAVVNASVDPNRSTTKSGSTTK